MRTMADVIERVRALEERLDALGFKPPSDARGLRMSEILTAVSAAFDVPATAIAGDSQMRPRVRARQAAMLLASEVAGRSSGRIGLALDRDGSTVRYGIAQARELRAADPDFARRLDAARAALTQRSPA